MRKIIQDYDAPALSALTRELTALLDKALAQAAFSRKQAEEVIKDLPFPQYREQHLPGSNLQLDPRILEHLYVDQGKSRKIEELLSIAVDVLNATEAEAKLCADQLQQLAGRLRDEERPAVVHGEFEQAVACVAALCRWSGRADFSLHYAKYRDKSVKISTVRRRGGLSKSEGQDRYRRILFEKLLDLSKATRGVSINDLIDNHQAELEKLNAEFSANSGSSYDPPEVINLGRYMRGWAKRDEGLRALMQRLEEELQKTERKSTRRGR